MVEITKLFALAKFESLRGSTSALKISEILAIRKQPLATIGKFLKLEVALSLRYLLTI